MVGVELGQLGGKRRRGRLGTTRRSSNNDAEAVEENEQLLWHNALKGLIDALTCLVFGLGLVRLLISPT